ncbi:MAG: elongation factor G [Candidatus Hydrogenedentota bacterium]
MDPGKVRNIGIAGHGGVGKTSIVEQILHNVGVTNRRGKVEDGNSVSDYLDEEVQHKHSIQLCPAHIDHEGHRLHFVDIPGYSDFIGELAAAAPMLDAMLIVVDASIGPQIGTDNAYKYAEKYNIPRAFFINKLERENTDFDEMLSVLRDTYGNQLAPIVVPVGKAHELNSAVNILGAQDLDDAQSDMKLALTEAVAESDDTLIEKYLDAGELTQEELESGLRKGVTACTVMPVIGGSAEQNIGIDDIASLARAIFPAPVARTWQAKDNQGNDVEVTSDPNAPFLGQVFRSVVDPFVGHLTIFRVISGTLKSDGDFYNVTQQTKERTGKLYLINGKEHTQVSEVVPGEVAAMTKLKNTHFGDTIAASGNELNMPAIELPNGLVKLAIEPVSRADEDKIGEALNRLSEEDPTFSHYRDPATAEHVIIGMGDLQLDILMERLKNKYNVEAETRLPRVAYRETVKGQAEVQGKHKKQSGGHGQYGDVHLRIMPNERGAGYEFVDKIVGGVVPRQYIPAVDKGCQEAMEKGVISGHPVVDVRVELFFGSYHTVDSSEMAFKIAASIAIQKGVKEAKPIILEPIMELIVDVPDDCMGDINGDLNSRRGRIMGMEPGGPGRQRIKATVPESEILRYSADLRSITAGRGTHEVSFHTYEEVPEHVAKEIVAEYEKRREEESS